MKSTAFCGFLFLICYSFNKSYFLSASFSFSVKTSAEAGGVSDWQSVYLSIIKTTGFLLIVFLLLTFSIIGTIYLKNHIIFCAKIKVLIIIIMALHIKKLLQKELHQKPFLLQQLCIFIDNLQFLKIQVLNWHRRQDHRQYPVQKTAAMRCLHSHCRHIKYG